MLSELTPIYFETALEFVPVEDLKFDKRTVRKLFDALAEEDAHPYENLHLQGISPYLSTDREVGESVLRIAPFRITIEEERPDISVKLFESKVDSLLKSLDRVLSDSKKNSPPVMIQKCRIQCTAQPHASKNSVELLADKVAQVFDKIKPFGRPPAYFGVRFRFPAVRLVEDDEEEGESQANESDREEVDFDDWVTLRFETYAKDISLVWMEIQTMNVFSDTIEIGKPESLTGNIHRTYNFLEEKCVAFLNQFDVVTDNPGGEQT